MASFSQPVVERLRGLRAVVTGSSKGIGRSVALALVDHGAGVVVHGRPGNPEGRKVAEEIRRSGGTAQFVAADLRDPQQCDRLVEDAWSALGGVDLWFNNAGADPLTGPAAKLSFVEKLRLLIETDLIATVRLSRGIGQRMQQAGGGHIINMGWDQAQVGMAGESAELFSAVKGGIMSFTKSLALSLAPTVRVNCLAPGYIRTQWGEGVSEAWQQRVIRETPLGRWGTPEDVANMVVFLASPAAAFITGQILCVNGGTVR
jgi:3-oxoacyl-[acyl-carrier protein] reductase